MVQTGLDVFLEEGIGRLRGRRVGVLCHPASVSSRLLHIVDALAATEVKLTRLFGPEHGIRGEAQDMIGVEGNRDPRTGIPVTSLYGESFESLSPSAAELADVDVLLVDLQDVIVHVMLPRIREFYALEKLWDVRATDRAATS